MFVRWECVYVREPVLKYNTSVCIAVASPSPRHRHRTSPFASSTRLDVTQSESGRAIIKQRSSSSAGFVSPPQVRICCSARTMRMNRPVYLVRSSFLSLSLDRDLINKRTHARTQIRARHFNWRLNDFFATAKLIGRKSTFSISHQTPSRCDVGFFFVCLSPSPSPHRYAYIFGRAFDTGNKREDVDAAGIKNRWKILIGYFLLEI